MIVLGLTGGIGMGKTTTAAMFAARGVPVWDADAAVHQLYGPGGAAVAPLAARFPGAVRDGVVDRDALKQVISKNTNALRAIEQIVHPLVAAHRQEFLDGATGDIVLLDIPLLFETGGERWCNYTITVSVAPDIQKKRVLARPGMTESQFQTILGNQMSDADRRARADFVIDTTTLETAEQGVDRVVQAVGADSDA